MNSKFICCTILFLLLIGTISAQRRIGFGQNFTIQMNITQEEYIMEKRSVMAIIGINITVENVADELTERKITDKNSFDDIYVVSKATDIEKKETIVTEVLGMEKDFLDRFSSISEFELKGQVEDYLNAVENPFEFRIVDSDIEKLFDKKLNIDEFAEKLFA